MSKALNLKNSRQKLLELPDYVTDEPVIVTDGDKPVTVALSYEQYASLLETLEISEDENFLAQLKESINQDMAGERIDWEISKKQLEMYSD